MFFILNSSRWVTPHWGIALTCISFLIFHERGGGFFYLSPGRCWGLPWMRDERAPQPAQSGAQSDLYGTQHTVCFGGFQYLPRPSNSFKQMFPFFYPDIWYSSLREACWYFDISLGSSLLLFFVRNFFFYQNSLNWPKNIVRGMQNILIYL